MNIKKTVATKSTVYYNIYYEYGAFALRQSVQIVGSCATEGREPCQAGNRAALSGFSVCRSKSFGLHTLPHSRASIFWVVVLMYRALYRKYRPATFSEVSGQNHVTETLKNELKMGRISHAYLFTAQGERARPAVPIF